MTTEPYPLTGFLAVNLVRPVSGTCIGRLAAGWRAARSVSRDATRPKAAGRPGLLGGAGIGAWQRLVGGGVAGLLALTTSGFAFQNPNGASVRMSPKVFMGSLFVALTVFLYVSVGGLLLGPVFGTLINRAVQAHRHAGGKEDLVVR